MKITIPMKTVVRCTSSYQDFICDLEHAVRVGIFSDDDKKNWSVNPVVEWYFDEVLSRHAARGLWVDSYEWVERIATAMCSNVMLAKNGTPYVIADEKLDLIVAPEGW